MKKNTTIPAKSTRAAASTARGSARRGRARSKRFPRGARSDVEFRWMSDPALENWRALLAAWTAQHGSKQVAVQAGNTMLDYLEAHPGVVRRPSVFCRRDYRNPTPLRAWLGHIGKHANIIVAIHAFFCWLLEPSVDQHDTGGRQRLCNSEHWNPIPRPAGSPNRSETHRNALPSRLLRDLVTLLTENDWAWAKLQRKDWIKVKDPQGRVSREWCPVRASALALMLLLPLRGFQVRMLESGEGDSQVYRNGQWLANNGPHAPKGRRAVKRGFLRAFRDRTTGAVATGFFVNTNKTTDRLPDEAEEGYEMPWQHEQAIAVVERLRDWQETFNALDQPLAWADIHDEEVRLATVPRPGAAFFLFRDPRGFHPNQPLTWGRLEGLWGKLMATLEDRLAKSQERLPSGGPIRLTEIVYRQQRRNELLRADRCPLYDLHSLRVSLLTALAHDGGVPLHILSKCVAGHASMLMTLYYIKDMGEVSECLVEASAKIDAESRRTFARYLGSADRTQSGFVANDLNAAAALLDNQPEVGWLQMSHGICPAAGTLCHQGGPVLPGIGKHGPVPGGRYNCVRCRHFATGPAYLPGLVAVFNTISQRVNGASADWEAAKAQRTSIENARYDAEEAGSPFDEGELIQAHSRVEAAESALDQHLGSLQATYGLIERCKTVATRSPGFNLVLAGGMNDWQTALRVTTRSELEDRICQQATVHPTSEELNTASRRGRDLDRLLRQWDQAPVFMHLSEQDALVAGNEMTKLMVHRFGGDAVFRVLSGDEGLLEAGVGAQLRAIVDEVQARPASSTGVRALPAPEASVTP